MTPLRQRMLEDMEVRNLAPRTRECYVEHVAKFAQFHGCCPSRLGLEDVRAYLAYLAHERCLSPNTRIPVSAALRFLYRVTLDRASVAQQIPYPKQTHKLPLVLSRQEVARFFVATPSLKYRAILALAYGAGLRVAEVARLRLVDIDRERVVIRVQQGKGRRDRYALLSERLLGVLEVYIEAARPTTWLFPSRRPDRPIHPATIQSTVRRIRQRSGIDKPATMHTLRHSFATLLLDDGTDLRIIQKLLGHRNLRTTAIYAQVSMATMRQVVSPLDHLPVSALEGASS